MSGPAYLAIAAGVLVDAALKATLLLGIGAVAARGVRGASAAQRHAIWAVTLAALPVLPLLAATRGTGVALDAGWLVGVWAVGFALVCAPLVSSLLALDRLCRGATPDPRAPGVLRSEAVAGPLTWGLFRPVIVMPAAAAAWSAGDYAAALAHERAHVARRDWAVHIGTMLVCALFWFHPLVWHARRELAIEAEHAADDLVLAEGVRATDYARLLLSLAVPTHALAVSAGASPVGRRVRALLTQRARSARRRSALGAALLGAALGCPVLAALPAWSPPPPQSLTCLPGPT